MENNLLLNIAAVPFPAAYLFHPNTDSTFCPVDDTVKNVVF